MRAIAFQPSGGPDTLELTDAFLPPMGDTDVCIKVAAAGVNRADILQRKGYYPAPEGASEILGLEVSGIVDSVGAGVTRWKPGDKVCALLPGGGYAEYAIANEALCLPIPASMSMIEAAATPEAIFTVWNNVFMRGHLREGQKLLVHGGTSGIGTFAIQIAAQLGAIVYTTTGSLEKRKRCLQLGAKEAIVRSSENYVTALHELEPNGIDVVLDMSGGETLGRDLHVMALDGRHVSIAHMTGKSATIDIPTLMKKRLTVTGSTLRGRPLTELSNLAKEIEKTVWHLLAAGKVIPVIDQTYPLERAGDAHRRLEAGQHIGKIVLTL